METYKLHHCTRLQEGAVAVMPKRMNGFLSGTNSRQEKVPVALINRA
jgi:hypothetical protein